MTEVHGNGNFALPSATPDRPVILSLGLPGPPLNRIQATSIPSGVSRSIRRSLYDFRRQNMKPTHPLAASSVQPIKISIVSFKFGPEYHDLSPGVRLFHRLPALPRRRDPPNAVAADRRRLPSSCAKPPSSFRPRLARSLAAVALPPPGVSGYNSSAVFKAETACTRRGTHRAIARTPGVQVSKRTPPFAAAARGHFRAARAGR